MNDWVTNKKMKECFLKISTNFCNDELQLNMKGLERLFSPPIKVVKDCVIITERNIEEIEPYIENAIRMYGDRTGYEASNTETRINCFFENEISETTGVKVALIVLEIWAMKLKKIEPKSSFCLIMCSDENRVEIRFHKVREDEANWLSEDLEMYKGGAVGYIII